MSSGLVEMLVGASEKKHQMLFSTRYLFAQLSSPPPPSSASGQLSPNFESSSSSSAPHQASSQNLTSSMAAATATTAPVSPNFFGKYKLATSSNFDAFLKEIGVGLVKRKLADNSYPTVEFTKDENGNFSFKSITVIKTSETRFRLGEEFDEDRLDGKRVKSMVVADGNKFIQTQRDGPMEIKYIREFGNDEIRVTSIANDVKSFRVYKRVPE